MWANRYEPVVNWSYTDLARHYGMLVVPARPYRPRDKAKVEAGVQLVEWSVLEALRERRFESLGECDAAIRKLLEEINGRPFQQQAGTRWELFEELWCRCLSLHLDHVTSPRSSNPACSSPALGSRSRS